MNRSIKTIVIIILLSLVVGWQNASSEEPSEEKRISMNFPKTDINIALDVLSREINIPIVSDVALSGEISIISKIDLTIEEAIASFNSALRSRDLAIIRTEQMIRIVKIADAKRDSVKVHEGMEPSLIKESDEIITQIMRLENIDVDNARDSISKLVNARYGDISIHAPTNTVIITDTSSNVKRLARILLMLDSKPGPSEEMRVYHLKYALAEDIKSLLGQLGSKTSEGGFFFGGKKLKREAEEEILKLQGSITINVDKEANALIVSSYPGNFPSIEKLIAEFDKVKAQALIEVVICEYTLDSEDTLGLEWTYTGTRKVGTGDLDFDLSEKTSGFKYSFLDVADWRLDTLLFALAEKESLEILSSPRVLALDGKQAVITVGKSVPILESRTLVSAATITTEAEYDYSYNYEDVGIKLSVTPTIHSSEEATLKIVQEVKSLTSETLFGSPVIVQRNAEAEVLVKNNQTVILGGMMKDNRAKTEKKVPVLGDIPVMGVLFRKSSWITEKTELLVFINPHIITDPTELAKMTQDQKVKTKDLILPEDGMPPIKRVSGKITSVLSDKRFFINLGSEKGIETGMKLKVYEDNRSVPVGTVVVDVVTQSSALVLAEKIRTGEEFRKGYLVCSD